MKWHCSILILLSVLLPVGCKWFAPRSQVSFENLRKDESIYVQFDSRGCFHHTTFQLWVEQTPSGVTSLAASNSSGGRLHPIELNRTDLKSLNFLMSWYRHNQHKGCTTMDTITVTKFHLGVPVVTEKFVDDSCELGNRIEMPTFSTYYERAGGR